MTEYLQIHNNGEITLPPVICRAAKLQEGDLPEVVVEAYGSIRLVPKSAEERLEIWRPATRRRHSCFKGEK